MDDLRILGLYNGYIRAIHGNEIKGPYEKSLLKSLEMVSGGLRA